MAPARPQVPDDILARLRAICAALPDAHEESAWVGRRWKVRAKTFAHVLIVADGRPPAYAKAARAAGPLCVVTFRSFQPEVDAETFRRAPYFKPVWWPDIAGMVLTARTDWDEVKGRIVGSYRMLAPRKLVEAMDAGQVG